MTRGAAPSTGRDWALGITGGAAPGCACPRAAAAACCPQLCAEQLGCGCTPDPWIALRASLTIALCCRCRCCCCVYAVVLCHPAGTAEQPPLEGLYQAGMPLLQQCLYQFHELLKEQHPRLGLHLEQEGVVPSMYCTHWFNTLFAYSLPFEQLLRVWDVFLLEGMKVGSVGGQQLQQLLLTGDMPRPQCRAPACVLRSLRIQTECCASDSGCGVLEALISCAWLVAGFMHALCMLVFCLHPCMRVCSCTSCADCMQPVLLLLLLLRWCFAWASRCWPVRRTSWSQCPLSAWSPPSTAASSQSSRSTQTRLSRWAVQGGFEQQHNGMQWL